jgi:hypothetical protein
MTGLVFKFSHMVYEQREYYLNRKMKEMAFCGKWNRGYAAHLKNAL